MSKTKKNINKKYNRVARFYDLVLNPMDAMSPKKWRMELMEELEGRVLEVGVGTGKNIELYPDNLDIVAIDFSEKMLEKAEEKAKVLGKKISLVNMDVKTFNSMIIALTQSSLAVFFALFQIL